MNCFALDVETTTHSKGNAFDSTNKFVLGAIGTDTDYINYTSDNWHIIQDYINTCKMVMKDCKKVTQMPNALMELNQLLIAWPSLGVQVVVKRHLYEEY